MSPAPAPQLTPEEQSKDEYFQRIAQIGQEMIAAHGRDFATGAFVLAARWISEGRMEGRAATPGQTAPNARPS